MRKQSRNNRATRSERRPAITMILLTAAILTAGAVTVVSRQSLSERQTMKTSPQSLNNAAGHTPAMSTQHLRQPDDALASGLKNMIDQSTEGLAEVRHSDGSVSVNLEDRFQSVTVAKDDNGRLSQSCVDNPQAAGAFFNIDPKLIDKKSRALVSPANNE